MLVLGTFTKALAGTAAAAAAAAGLTFSLGPGVELGHASAGSGDCTAVVDRLPDDLRADLAALHGLTGSDLREAKSEVRQDARAGAYGKKVQRFARHPHPRLHAVVKRLPGELKNDVLEALALPDPELQEAMAQIRQGALAGDYGPFAQQVAERVQDHCDGDAA